LEAIPPFPSWRPLSGRLVKSVQNCILRDFAVVEAKMLQAPSKNWCFLAVFFSSPLGIIVYPVEPMRKQQRLYIHG